MTLEKMRDKALFRTGQMSVTRGVLELCRQDARFAAFVSQSFRRHLSGDWGDLDDEDKRANDRALQAGERLFSAFNDDRFPKHGVANIWIITEADRSATTILFPDEY